ncbi:helix-turn-helix domain-containing protein [Ruminococcaceae bacterium OttesenSCG-928-O06]|nr:helix-turn-helix domain-containing protein [Ruminococcaceae bacterium OttesenSCG-928-O06]
MQIGERIKHARTHRGMTQKELGMAVGFDEKTADVRIAQYESSTRVPKADMRNKLAEALHINYRYFFDSHNYAAEDIMFLLFELDEQHQLELSPFDNDGATGINIHIPYPLVDDFLAGWMKEKQALADGSITKSDYTEWKLNWPRSADDRKDK